MENYFETLLHNMWEDLVIDIQKNQSEKEKLLNAVKVVSNPANFILLKIKTMNMNELKQNWGNVGVRGFIYRTENQQISKMDRVVQKLLFTDIIVYTYIKIKAKNSKWLFRRNEKEQC